MPRGRGLSFEQGAVIALYASPARLLGEGLTDEEAVAELIGYASQYPRRTQREIARYGPGAPKIRRELISEALGDAIRTRNVESPISYRHAAASTAVRLLTIAAEQTGGVLEEIVAEHSRPSRVIESPGARMAWGLPPFLTPKEREPDE